MKEAAVGRELRRLKAGAPKITCAETKISGDV